MTNQTPKKSKNKHYFASAILIGIIIVAVYIGIITLDIGIPYINPPDQQTEIPISLGVYYSGYGITPDIELALYIRCNGTLTVGQSAELSAIGYLMTPNSTDTIGFDITVSLAQAFPAKNDSNNIPASAVVKLRNNGQGELTGDSVTVSWAIPGDFPPIGYRYDNRSMMYPASFSPNAVHVEPASVLNVEKFNRVNMGVTFALIYFALIEAFSKYYDYRKK
jgi:hypothetical protein